MGIGNLAKQNQRLLTTVLFGKIVIGVGFRIGSGVGIVVGINCVVCCGAKNKLVNNLNTLIELIVNK